MTGAENVKHTLYRDDEVIFTSDTPINAFLFDRQGTLWIAVWQQDRCEAVDLGLEQPTASSDGTNAMYEDRRGRFWIGWKSGLVLGQVDGAARTWAILTTPSGLPSSRVLTITETRDGTLLFGTLGGGLLRYNEAGDFEALTTDEGLPSNNVRDLYEDHEGYLWIILEDRGLCRLDRRGRLPLLEAELACIDTQDGLYWDGLHRLLEDDQGRYWFNSNYGIFWVERSALQAYFAGESTSIASVSYTERDGMRVREGNGGRQPAGIRARDGHLWFPTQDGVVIIDPDEVPRTEPPAVVLDAVHVGEEARATFGTVALSAAERDLEIRYTAPEFMQPEDVRFQYRLDGYNDAWQDAGAQHIATYTNLSPGRYTFEVRAALGGVWGEVTRLPIESLILMNTPPPLREADAEPQHPHPKEHKPAFDTTRLEVDALRAMLSLPPQAERRERREDDPERPHP